MKNIAKLGSWILACGLCAIPLFSADAPTEGPYANDFEKADAGKPADEFLILNGNFNVVSIDKNKCLEVDGDPIDGDGFLFGPAGLTNSNVSARIWAAATGKRTPEFGIGANDAGGYKLIVVPALAQIELRKGDDMVKAVPYAWKSETWTRLRLHVAKTADGKFHIEGKAWANGSAEPSAWMISADEIAAPSPGRASAWAMPYSETPIRFDDLGVDMK